ncbi:hypothetical protein CAPTEDRAFT_216457 [Capitella teleta]|uniref:DUF547 domain-containing protein n=1 Tax=Capitella teleta TaxID=283909 RepID=R7TDY3_CAPTE|nr:hypothetical protein CAPTEDRAFT_216457 [Capitella teleta]|eukprot:ELT91929.1 hypothetical protein CAPTEDRAFT_216457 [Capitella teleta]
MTDICDSLVSRLRSALCDIYNALTIHGLITSELPSSVLSIQLFWKTTAYNIGGHVFSLDEIEHGILRGNRPHPASKTAPFGNADPRLKFILKEVDPRIHFALVCGAKVPLSLLLYKHLNLIVLSVLVAMATSCPAIQVYTEENIEQALQGATSAFCSEEVKCYTMQKEIHVSKIFQWYRIDFGGNDVEAIRWTLPFLAADKRKDLKSLLHTLEERGMVDISYRKYDWNLNKI